MYHVHAFATPNSVKVPIALEELGIDYTLHAVNVRKGEQKNDAFLALNANGKVPVLTTDDRDFTLTSQRPSLFISLRSTASSSRKTPCAGLARLNNCSSMRRG